MIKVGIKSVLIGFIVTACISLIYPINKVNVLAGINVALIIAAFIAFFIDYKKNLEKENNNLIFKEEIKEILKDNSVLYEILKQLKDRKELDTISNELKNRAELNTIIDNLKVLEFNRKKEQIEVLEVIRDRKELEAIIKELRDRKELEVIIKELKNRKELEDITRELKNRSELNELIKETKDFKILSEKLKDEILIELKNKEKEIVSAINKGIKTLKANDGENIVESIEDLIKEVSQKLDDNKKTREKIINDNFDSIIEVVEKLSENTEQQLNDYKKTTENVTKQLDGVVKESGVNVKLIKDSYSILNSLMEN
ncbi:hypothetical protein GNF40_06815 [Clostridium perfringens]|uniref:hypothetical protein n=1 Tax=Clostridium perfringens TaxID=1502 RepID=UPI002AC6D6AD|nr:hypothetical protein [Clostridium perfringens]MDZ5005847.1 hypothetical protein [Clostridium perfringens]